MTREEAEAKRQELSRLARTITQAEWDRLYPPRAPSDHEMRVDEYCAEAQDA